MRSHPELRWLYGRVMHLTTQWYVFEWVESDLLLYSVH
jgi:hypothetical protein